MIKTIELRNPIKVNGEMVDKIEVNTEEITAALYAEADVRKRIAAGAKNVAIIPTAEFDFALHTYLGFAAAIAANHKFTFSDLESIRGIDVIAFNEVGRNFLLKSEDVDLNTSSEQSEISPDISTQA